MKFGVNLPNFGADMTPDAMKEWTLTVERDGFDTVLVSDHVALTDDAHRRSPAPFFESLSTVAWLAGLTSTIRLGTGVLIGSHRHPVALAHSTATIDQLSAGRLTVGIGVGWAAQAFDVLGVPYRNRGRLTDETLETLIAAWTSPILDYPGTTEIHRLHTGPQPVQSPHPPIWIGGNGQPALDRVNRYGTAWHPLHPSRRTCTHGVAGLKEGKEFAPRIFFLPTAAAIDSPDRPLGYGSIDQILGDLAFLDDLGAGVVVLDTDPGDARLRRSWRHDLELLRYAARVLEL